MRLLIPFFVFFAMQGLRAQYNVLELRSIEGYHEQTTGAIYANSFFVQSFISFIDADHQVNNRTHQFELRADSSIYSIVGQPITLGDNDYGWRDNQRDTSKTDIRFPHVFYSLNQGSFNTKATEAGNAVGTMTILAANDTSIHCAFDLRIVNEAETLKQYYQGNITFKILNMRKMGIADYSPLPTHFLPRRSSAFAWSDTGVTSGMQRSFEVVFAMIDSRLAGGRICRRQVCPEIGNNGATIDSIVHFMTINPHAQIEIRAHTDTRGHPKANEMISRRYAQAVVDALHERGVNPDRMTPIGKGESEPLITNEEIEALKDEHTRELAHWFNHRYEVVVR